MEKELENAFVKDQLNRLGGWVVRFKGMNREYSFVACEREGDPDTLASGCPNAV